MEPALKTRPRWPPKRRPRAAQAADCPRRARAWGSPRRHLALQEASGAPASRRLSLLGFDIVWHVTRSRPLASRCDEIHARPCAAAAASRTVLSPMPLDRVLARPACSAHAVLSAVHACVASHMRHKVHRTKCTAHASHLHRMCCMCMCMCMFMCMCMACACACVYTEGVE